MSMNRRQALQTLLLGGPLMAAGGVRLAMAASYKPSLFLIGGIDGTISASRLFSVLDPIVSQNIPVGIVIDFSGKNPIAPDSKLAGLFRALHTDYRGLVELIAYVPNLSSDAPYFRMRRASDARAAFCALLNNDDAGCMSGALTIATDMPEGAVDEINGVRASGFRNLLLLPHKAGKAGYWEIETDVLQFYGGQPIYESLDKGVVDTALRQGFEDEVLVVYLALEGAGSDQDAFLMGAVVGDALLLKNSSGDIYSSLPTDMHLRSGTGYGRLIGLQVEGGDTPDMVDFTRQLRLAGLPFTRVVPLDFVPMRNGVVAEYCLELPADEGDLHAVAVALKALDTWCVSVETQTPEAIRLATSVGAKVLSLSSGRGAFGGIDKNGIFHAPVAFSFAGATRVRTAEDARSDLLTAIGSQNDAVITVTPAALSDPSARKAIVGALSGLVATGESKVRSLAGLRQTVAAGEQKYDLLKSANLQRALAVGEARALDETATQKLMQDAKVAWHFFEKLTNEKTGLVPGTVWMDGDESSFYPYATMWDVGTLVLAFVSAHMLGLIDDAELKVRAEKMLAHMPLNTVNGLLLPQASASVSGRAPLKIGFDSTDAGRLLISLKVLEAYVDYDLGIAAMVGEWDLGKTILNGQLRGIVNGHFTSPMDSAYAHYAARGFALWGFDVKSPHVTGNASWDFDAAMGTLTNAAFNGPISTEPHVLEEIEMGYSEAAKTIADVLYTAQLAEHESTGELVCVSEGPLDREPWFTYQGFQIGADEPWTVKTIDTSARYKTAGFQRAVEMVSTKAAFLWLAARPQDYSQLLVDHVREVASFEDLGFASGVFTATGLPTAHYSDINTNGIILQSIAYILRGRKPLLS